MASFCSWISPPSIQPCANSFSPPMPNLWCLEFLRRRLCLLCQQKPLNQCRLLRLYHKKLSLLFRHTDYGSEIFDGAVIQPPDNSNFRVVLNPQYESLVRSFHRFNDASPVCNHHPSYFQAGSVDAAHHLMMPAWDTPNGCRPCYAIQDRVFLRHIHIMKRKIPVRARFLRLIPVLILLLNDSLLTAQFLHRSLDREF